MGRAFSAFSAAPWGQANPGSARGNLTVGVSLGSGYQSYFSGLTSQEQSGEITAMKTAGVTWVRMDVAWTAKVQSGGTSTSYDFSYAMKTAQPMLDAGINLLLILLWSPAWALALGNNPTVPNDPFPTISPTQYAAFCGAAAAHFGPRGVSAFELWNEPNLDDGDSGHALGLGYLSPIGYAGLATAAYSEIHSNYVAKPGGSPTPTVVGGVMAGWPRLDWSMNPRAGASWPAVAAGATSATVTCPSAQPGDRYRLITGSEVSVSVSGTATNGLWPGGTYVSDMPTSTSYVVSPPPWLSQFPAVNASGSGATFGVENGYPADVFLTQLYAAAGGKPMFDAVSFHPYAWPGLGAFRYLDSGTWAMVPELRQVMVANGDGAKSIWFTELGAPTGQSLGSWPAAAATAGELVVSSGSARAEDLGYLAGVAGLPLGSYVATVNPGQSWTLMPPTGLTVNQTLAAGSTITQLSVAAASSVVIPPIDGGSAKPTPTAVSASVTIPPSTKLTVWLGNGNGYYDSKGLNGFAQAPFTVSVTATSAPVTIAPGGTASLTIDPAVVPPVPSGYTFPVGGLIQGARNLGQTWTAAVPAANRALLNLLAPGVFTPWSIGALSQNPSALSSEEQQATLIAYAYQFVVSTPWPYVGPMFVYCWSDASSNNNAGSYGLTRVDGSPKPAIAALSAIAQTGGRSPGLGLPGYI
jgi:hypothetical protein